MLWTNSPGVFESLYEDLRLKFDDRRKADRGGKLARNYADEFAFLTDHCLHILSAQRKRLSEETIAYHVAFLFVIGHRSFVTRQRKHMQIKAEYN
jgi:high-affinity nickel permease